MSIDFRTPLHESHSLFGFVPIKLYVAVVESDTMCQRKAALSQINALLRLFLKFVPRDLDYISTPRDGGLLEIIAHMSSFLTFLQKLLDIENGQLVDECFSMLMLLIKHLPTHVLISIKDFLLATVFLRLDMESIHIEKLIHTTSLMLCERLPIEHIFEFILLHLHCGNATIRRNSVNVLTMLILMNKISPLQIEMVCSELVQTLFDSQPKVLKAVIKCFATISSLNYISEDQLSKYFSNSVPCSFEEGMKETILRSVEMHAKMQSLPKLGSDGILVCEPGISDLRNPDDSNVSCVVGLDKSNNRKVTMKPPQRLSPWRTAVRRTQESPGYADHFSALQQFQKVAQSQPVARIKSTNLTDGKKFPLTSVLGNNLRISGPSGDAISDSYAHIAEKRRLKSNEIQSGEQPLFLESLRKRSVLEKKQNGLRRCYSALSFEDKDGESRTSFSQIADSIMSIKFSASKRLDSLRSRISQLRNIEYSLSAKRALKAMDSFEKTRSWTRDSLRNCASNVTAITSKENRETLAPKCSVYISEDVNRTATTKSKSEVVSERYRDENGGEPLSRKSASLISPSAVEKQMRSPLRKSLKARLKRSRTVHWTSRISCPPNVDVRSAVEALTSKEWKGQHNALRFLGCFFEANPDKAGHELCSWSPEQIQQLCHGLVFAASSLRSQVSRMAIESIKSIVKLLTPEQLEPVTRSLFLGLVGRVGGDACTTFLRKEACEAIDLLVERAPASAVLVCLNDACHNTPSRSLLGRRCLVRCYAAVLPRLLTTSTCLLKGDLNLLTRKYKDIFDRMLPHLASFLRNGDFETRNNGEKILRMLMTIRDFETHLKLILDDYDRGTFTEAIDKLFKRKSNSTLRTSRKLTFSRVAHGRSSSRPFNRRALPPSPLAPLPLTPLARLPDEDGQCNYCNDSSQSAVPPSGDQERLFCLLELGAQIKEDDFPTKLSTSEIVGTVLPMLRDENEEITIAALKLCLDARQLDIANSHCQQAGDKFCPGLLSLLCEREDTEGFMCVLALIYQQLHSKLTGVSKLSRKCLDETRRILGVEALVKPLLKAICLSTSDTVNLVHELCDLTANLDAKSPLIARHLLPAAVRLLRRCCPLSGAEQRQCGEGDPAEHNAIATFIRCLANLVGLDTLCAAAAKEGLDDEISRCLPNPI